jgi:uncharacterized protein (DUF2164 family)
MVVPIELRDDRRQQVLDSVKRYFEEVMEQDIGDLKASMLLDFIIEEIGPTIYNTAVSDVQSVMTEIVSELDGTCYVPESGYWRK